MNNPVIARVRFKVSAIVALLLGVPGAAWAAGAAPAGGESAPAAAASASMSLLDYIQAGGALGYVLIVISIVALALVVRNMIVLRAEVLAPPDLVMRLLHCVQTRDGATFRQCVSGAEGRSFVSETLRSAIDRCSTSSLGFIEVRAAAEDAARVQADRLHRLNDGVGIIAAVGPMLGLLGTVIGMIGAFQTIGTLEGAQRSSELARFMSLALVNTAQGLIVAIPCTIVFALFRRRIDALVDDATEIIERFIPAMPGLFGPAQPAGGPAQGQRGAGGAGRVPAHAMARPAVQGTNIPSAGGALQ